MPKENRRGKHYEDGKAVLEGILYGLEFRNGSKYYLRIGDFGKMDGIRLPSYLEVTNGHQFPSVEAAEKEGYIYIYDFNKKEEVG